MTFSLKDLRLTVQRRTGRDQPVVYPRLLRDRSALPKIEMAIRYFESMLGRERRDFDPEVLTHFFGDHKVTRCLLACLARAYRFEPPRFDEVLPAASFGALQRQALDTPRGLRLRLYDHVNEHGYGFIPETERASVLAELERRLGLGTRELEPLLHLDSEEHAILSRIGSEPRPADVAAQYNFGVVETLLRHAELVEIGLHGWDLAEIRAARGLCEVQEVECLLSASGRDIRLRLSNRQDALGYWGRHGRRLARAFVQILLRAEQPPADGIVALDLRGRRAYLHLTREHFGMLGCDGRGAGWEDAFGWEPEDVGTALRLPLGAGGWGLRRQPPAQAWERGVIVPDAMLRGPEQRVQVCVVSSRRMGQCLAPLAAQADCGEPLLFVGPAEAVAPLADVGAWVVALERFVLGAVVAHLQSEAGNARVRARLRVAAC
jgi:predicted nuclease of restriction endonuclease-like RecB superfamily